ncbi:SgcJ/EcaC family oxidoreductase [Rhizobium ruizarguesonis]|uniref:YybH family protein n=1 Tax=Rhizobium ruizarguesonis TaxID=2081791 RepID=UPI001030D347|nr:SgcJ/EcaC family oxidoreductase [Rhizobium ruizarguesonis]TBD63418.1 SgcJ/EcaC family oxidoreductase [Rhizobium ruizarguesonis]
MSDHPLRRLIEDADRAIASKDFDALMEFYADDATLVVKPGINATGKEQILRAFHAISAHFDHGLKVWQGKMEVIEGGDTALVLMETVLDYKTSDGYEVSTTRRATYVFRKETSGGWLCVVDNSYGTALLDQ